jgi:hypothetical protein
MLQYYFPLGQVLSISKQILAVDHESSTNRGTRSSTVDRTRSLQVFGLSGIRVFGHEQIPGNGETHTATKKNRPPDLGLMIN